MKWNTNVFSPSFKALPVEDKQSQVSPYARDLQNLMNSVTLDWKSFGPWLLHIQWMSAGVLVVQSWSQVLAWSQVHRDSGMAGVGVH